MRKIIILSLLLALCVNEAIPAAEINHGMCSGYLGENRVLIDPNDNSDEEISQPEPKNTSGTISVVVTPKGKKYHYAGCRTVRKKYRVLTVEQARRQGYKPCKVCNPPSN